MKWFAARKRRKREEALNRAGEVIRRLFPEAVAFVAQEWIGMNRSMEITAPDVWGAQSLERRVLMFQDMSPALDEMEAKFPLVREKITESALKVGGSQDEARENIRAGIFVEALVSAGVDRLDISDIVLGA